MNLTAANVQTILKDCLYGEINKSKDDALIIEGVVNDFVLSKNKVESYREDIESMLIKLPRQFRKLYGGGWSFLNACMDEHEHQWGEHIHVEALYVLGMAIKKVKCQLPKEMWASLPGGMPYFVVNL